MQLYLKTAKQPATNMHKFSLCIKKSLESRSGFLCWVCREGTNFSCIAAEECFILHLSYTGLSFTVNVQHLYQLLQYSPIIPSGSTVQIFASVVNTPPPTPYLLHWVMRNWTCKKLTKGRAEVRLVQNTTLLTQSEILWRTPDPRWGLSASIWQHVDHQQLQACGLSSGGAFQPLLVWHPELLLSKVQEQLLKSHSGVVRVKHTNCCIYLRLSTLSLPQACFKCYASLLLSCKVTICCFLPSTPVCQGMPVA